MNDYQSVILGKPLGIPSALLLSFLEELKTILLNLDKKNGFIEIGDFLEDYYKRKLAGSNESLYTRCINANLGFSDITIRRAIGKKAYQAKYELLDLICYACTKKSMAEVLLNEYSNATDAKYFVEPPEYARNEIRSIRNSQNDNIPIVSEVTSNDSESSQETVIDEVGNAELNKQNDKPIDCEQEAEQIKPQGETISKPTIEIIEPESFNKLEKKELELTVFKKQLDKQNSRKKNALIIFFLCLLVLVAYYFSSTPKQNSVEKNMITGNHSDSQKASKLNAFDSLINNYSKPDTTSIGKGYISPKGRRFSTKEVADTKSIPVSNYSQEKESHKDNTVETLPVREECEVNKTGDYCYVNSTNKKIQILFRQGVSTVSIIIGSGQTQCNYNIPSGVYEYSVTQEATTLAGQAFFPLGMEYLKGHIKVETCKSLTLNIQ